jgi:NADH dehydrogenase/NADH:ubiquinone oxidoreductase subunit G
VRFGKEVCGIDVLGTTGRGNNMEVTNCRAWALQTENLLP